MDKEWILIILVPVLFAVGILAFFAFFPPELITLTTLVGYMSSLSTIVMVLVYIFTTSRQLDTMRSQLEEMQYSRSVQIQPLPYLEKPKASLRLPRYYTSPRDSFKKMSLWNELNFTFSVSNFGNGPAISIDFIPSVAGISLTGKGTILLMETISATVDCVSLREGDSQDVKFHFSDDKNKVIEALLAETRVALYCTLVYKNSIGMAFQENICFWVTVPSEEDMEIVRSCLKISKTAEIDFAKHVKEFERLMNLGREEEAIAILEEVNAELRKRFAGKEELDLSMKTAHGSFELGPISQAEYEKLLSEKRVRAQKLAEIIRKCWIERGAGPNKSE